MLQQHLHDSSGILVTGESFQSVIDNLKQNRRTKDITENIMLKRNNSQWRWGLPRLCRLGSLRRIIPSSHHL